MKFSEQEDLKLLQAEVFARLSNFEIFKRIAIKCNVRVQQISQNNPNEDTLVWNYRFKVRGRLRDVEIRLVEFDEPNSMKLARSKFNKRFKSHDGKLAEFISQMPAA